MDKYKNKLTINQRGASITIDNGAGKESISISQRSGSNLNINNYTNSELATNNKQVNVVNDSFETTGNDKSTFIGGDFIKRVVGSVYDYSGFANEDELNAFQLWKNEFEDIAKLKSKFKIKRGGSGFPNGDSTELVGERADNPVVGSKVFVVNNEFTGYTGIPERRSQLDDVASYNKVPDRGNTQSGKEESITEDDVTNSAGSSGSNAPGVLEFGATKSASTEGGEWEVDTELQEIDQTILNKQLSLSPIEQQMGNGGDKSKFIKRDNFKQVGAVFNDYPSIRIDNKGRSQPFEMLVSENGTFKNHDAVPHVEEIDNSANFPGGNDTEIIGNSKSTIIGSGGWNIKTTGPIEMGGSTLKQGFKKININASHGIHIGSEEGVELQSIKTITLRTNRQVYVEGALGVKNNLIVGGGLSVEGETYLQHVTAPLEVQQTQDTIALGKFATDANRQLVIGECQIGGVWYPVYALADDDLIMNYPHSHHFNNLPLRLTKSNKDTRKFAQNEKINAHDNISQALPQMHERKVAKEA